jgi:glycerophosphoryl diester phosphodiesterase
MESGVRSPLQEAKLTKAEIRELSKGLDLPTWDKPSFACLASRFPYGTSISSERLRVIDEAETFLRNLGLRQMRVRHHEDIARIEVPEEEMETLFQNRERIVTKLKELGYAYVTMDLQGYRTGSMNETLDRSSKEKYMPPIEIVCHKGANEYAPENTFAAAQLCVNWGMDYVEIDVNTSKDGVLYILHGPELDKTTNGKGRIADMMSDEIDKLDAGSWFDPKFAGEKVPRLDPFLRWVKGKAKVFMDVKAADHRRLIDLVYDVGLENDCFFWSGDDEWALKLRQMAPELQLKINVDNVEDVISAHEVYGANIVEVSLDNMTQELVGACRQRGIKIMIFHSKKQPKAFREVLRWGVDMINLDHGDVFKKVAEEFDTKPGG